MKPELPDRFGPYEITGRLGAGGMGEVYRARDHRLQRDVAVKILPSAAAGNPDRQRRFTQEAITASALNHPNILVVYDVGLEGTTPYLVSELVDGQSLREEMSRGRLSLKRLLDVTLQIAEGLTAAHDAGIVHRDLKPENVMVTRGDLVKIVDFGLAKSDVDEGNDNPTNLTETARGLLVGTVPYMSPEQARGGRADFRSDQFAVGVILYELTTGEHPFRRESAVQTLSAIIGDEAPPLATVQPPLPLPLRWLIDRLLAKNPRERYAHTGDVAADLRIIRDRLTEAIRPQPTAPEPHGRSRRALWTAAAFGLAAGMFVLGQAMVPAGADLATYRFTPLATDAGFQGEPAFSPDGKTIAYVADVDGVLQVFTRSLSSPTRFQVTRSRFDCHDPFWSPDGSRLYYHALARDKEGLWYVSPAGGQPELLIEGAVRAAISPDGQTLAVLRDESDINTALTLWLSSPPGAEPKKYEGAPFVPAGSDGRLQYAPDGSGLLVWLTRSFDEGESNNGFWQIQSPAGKPTQVLPSLRGARVPADFSWLPDSRHIAFTRDDGRTPGPHLWIADVQTGDSRLLTLTSGSEGSPSVSPDGTRLAFTSEATDFDLIRIPIDGSPVQPLLSSTRNELDPAWSPVSAQHAFVTDRTGRQEIWLRNPDGEQRPLVTDGDFREPSTVYGSLAFSPDGQRIAYQRMSPESGWRIWISTLAGGSPVRLPAVDPNLYQDAPAWSADGNRIAFVTGIQSGGAGQWTLANTLVGGGGAPPIVLARDVIPFARAAWSPDGQWIACLTTEGLLLIAPDGKDRRVLADPVWLAYEWSADSREIFGLRPSDDLRSIELVVLDAASGRERVVNPNLGPIPHANQPIRGFSRIGKTGFASSIARVRSDIWLLDGLEIPRGRLARFWPFNRFGRSVSQR